MSEPLLPSRRYTCMYCGIKGRRGNQPYQRLMDPICPSCKRPDSALWREMRGIEAEFTETLDDRNQLIKAAQAVVDRWETPLWKDAEPTAKVINAMRNCLLSLQKQEP